METENREGTWSLFPYELYLLEAKSVVPQNITQFLGYIPLKKNFFEVTMFCVHFNCFKAINSFSTNLI